MLLKSVGLALALLAVLVIALSRLVAWLTSAGEPWAEGTLGAVAHEPLGWLGWLVAFALGSGLVAGAIVLMPAVTALVASFFTDEIAENVERSHYPLDPPGVACRCRARSSRALKTAALAIVVYICLRAVRDLRGLRRADALCRQRLAARPRLFRPRGHAVPSGGGGKDAAARCTAARSSSPVCSSPAS